MEQFEKIARHADDLPAGGQTGYQYLYSSFEMLKQVRHDVIK